MTRHEVHRRKMFVAAVAGVMAFAIPTPARVHDARKNRRLKETIMRRVMLIAIFALVPGLVFAHVGVTPRESNAGAEQAYTFRVPTEGTVPTSSLELEVPTGVTVLEAVMPEGGTVDVQKQGDRIVKVTWTKEIAPKQAAQFVLRTRNPKDGDAIAWRVRQRYTDGTWTDWVGPAGDRRPAPITKLVAAR